MVSFAVSGALWVFFFSYPFARFVFLPLAIAIALISWFWPPVGWALFLLTTLTTLQIPILLDLPFFYGPEVCFFPLWAVLSLRQLREPHPLELHRVLSGSLAVYGAAILLSILFVGLVVRDPSFPGLRVALSNIYFWHWDSPYHFLRIALLYLEGIAAFFLALTIFRTKGGHAFSWAVRCFLFLGLLLMGYSVVDLLYRGKEISVYPGYGPVFADRNAYAAFWTLYCPIALALAFGSWGVRRGILVILFLGGVTCAAISLSLSAAPALFVGLGLVLFFSREIWLRGRALAIGVASVAVVAVFGALAGDQKIAEGLRFRVGEIQKRGVIAGVLEERQLPWRIAWEMFRERPLLGIGVGRYYGSYESYRARFPEIPDFEYANENAHNYLLQMLAEMGILGAGSFFAFFVSVVYLGWKGVRVVEGLRRYYLVGLMGALVGMAVFSVAQHPMLRFEFQIYYWVFCAGVFFLLGSERTHDQH